MKAVILLLFALCSASAYGTVFRVGPGEQHTKPSQVMNLVNDGDTVEIEAGIYAGDVGSWTKNNLLIRGVGGYAHLQANGANAQGKGIWVVKGNNTRIEYIEFSGATVPDKNGAGIRQEGKGLHVAHCYFHDNEEGILAGDNPGSVIVVESSEFAGNGFGDGLSHNIYINHVAHFILRYCYMHHAKIGHQVKSRADSSSILYNRIMDEETGNSSMLLDLPNGGVAYVIGNLFMQGPNAENGRMVAYGAEGLSNPVNKLYVVNNTLVNRRNNATFFFIATGAEQARMVNNLMAGPGREVEGEATMATNLHERETANVGFVDEPNYDYHLTQGSAAIGTGSDPGSADGFNLAPIFEYAHPQGSVPRITNDRIDLGAYEYEGTTGAVVEENRGSGFRLYPNPVADRLLLEAPAAVIGKDWTVLFYSVAGELVRREEVAAGTRIVALDRGDLSSGLYALKISAGGVSMSLGSVLVR